MIVIINNNTKSHIISLLIKNIFLEILERTDNCNISKNRQFEIALQKMMQLHMCHLFYIRNK